MNGTVVRMILEQRHWSWAVIGIAVILAGLILRSLLLAGILRRIKTSNRKWYKRTLVYYEAHALPGWIAFGIYTLGFILLWRFDRFFLNFKHLNHAHWSLMFIASLAVSLFLHLRAYTRALVDAIQEHVVTDKDVQGC